MPSRHPPSPPPQAAAPQLSPPLQHPLIPPLAAAFSFLLFLALIYRKLTRRGAADPKPRPHHRRFSYSTLRRATSSFSPSNRLGQGGFGSVFRGTLKSGQEIAVKLMDSGSLQGEREFQNELNLSGRIESSYCVLLIGFCCERRRRRMLLVYELMHNRSLQDCLFDRKCVEFVEWRRRYKVALDVAKGLEFLHSVCDPAVIHGDIKPSNVLLDSEFNAKIADFGLARDKVGEEAVVVNVEGVKGNRKVSDGVEDNGSIVEENESVATGFEEVNCVAQVSPESFIRVIDAEASPDMTTFEASPSEILDKSVSDGNFDKVSVESRRDLVGNGSRRGGKKKSLSGKDWWWKQDNGGGSESGRVKDYVMEWIGTEIKKERPKSDWISTSDGSNKPNVKPEWKKQQKRLEWWSSLDGDGVSKKDKSRPAREWWREEFCDELAKKKKRREMKSGSNGSAGDAWWQRDDDSIPDQKKKKSKSRGSRGSIDWWLDGLSGEFRNGRRNSQDWTNGEVPKSGGVSSTPSMRGTVCYVAPEYGGGGQLSEKCDVYSYGVLILVLVSGRRPLQVTASPMSEFERANLISWARHLAQRGKLQDLFDPALQSLDQEQALRCVTVALLCLQRSPAKRPTSKEIVAILSGEIEPPHLPVEFSPSPPSNFPFKSRKKAR